MPRLSELHIVYQEGFLDRLQSKASGAYNLVSGLGKLSTGGDADLKSGYVSSSAKRLIQLYKDKVEDLRESIMDDLKKQGVDFSDSGVEKYVGQINTSINSLSRSLGNMYTIMDKKEMRSGTQSSGDERRNDFRKSILKRLDKINELDEADDEYEYELNKKNKELKRNLSKNLRNIGNKNK